MSDAVSGIVMAACNGAPATVTGGTMACDVPLAPGRNAVVLHALDAAGNTKSLGVSVTRTGTATALRLTPSTRTLLAGEVSRLVVVDDFGVSPSNVNWMSSDADVATVDATGRLTAVAGGAATITAESAGLSATATVTVVSGINLPAGTARWSVPPPSGFVLEPSIYTHRVNATDPDMFAVERDVDLLAPPVLRALTADGETLWIEAAPGAPRFGDIYGGVVTEIWNAQLDPVGLARLGGPGVLPWRYYSRGGIAGTAQAPDGTVYLVEGVDGTDAQGNAVVDMFIVVIDGATGAVRARLAQPRSVLRTTYFQELGGPTCTDSQSEQRALLSAPVIGLDGTAQIMVRQLDRTQRVLCGASGGPYDTDDRLTLLRVDATGAVTEHLLFRSQLVDNFSACAQRGPIPQYLVPDGLGGVLAKFAVTSPCNFVEHKLARVDAAGAQTDRTVTSTMQISITGDGDTAFVHDQGTLSAVDVISWTPRWSSSNDAAAPVLALADGGVALQRADGVLVIKDARGVTSEMAASPMANPSQIRLGVWTGVVQSELVAQTAAPLTDAPVWFARAGVFQGGGNALSHGAQNRRSFDTIEKAAVAALEHLYPVTEWSGWEWGGRICQTSRGFEWSNFVTNTDAGSVRTLDSPELTSEQRQQLPFCRPYPTTPHVAVFHTHTASIGQRFPSGMLAGSPEPNDMKTASLNPELKFFVRTPTADPKTRQTYRYQAQLIPDGQGGTVWSALYNTFKFVNGDWEIFPPPSNP